MNTTPQRNYWTGNQTELGQAWTLCKDGKVSRCVLLSHLFGFELRLVVGDDDLLQSHVCRSTEEVLDTQKAWQVAMLGKGWTE